eukprot:SAG31_NODE_1249_length_9118_cov_23.165318_4_plen_140_part_00
MRRLIEFLRGTQRIGTGWSLVVGYLVRHGTQLSSYCFAGSSHRCTSAERVGSPAVYNATRSVDCSSAVFSGREAPPRNGAKRYHGCTHEGTPDALFFVASSSTSTLMVALGVSTVAPQLSYSWHSSQRSNIQPMSSCEA